jgi:CspA family cold shock protein
MTIKGTVKAYDDGKGIGFIKGDDNKEYLVEFNAVRGSAGELKEDMRVEFDPVETPSGPQAADVRKEGD